MSFSIGNYCKADLNGTKYKSENPRKTDTTWTAFVKKSEG